MVNLLIPECMIGFPVLGSWSYNIKSLVLGMKSIIVWEVELGSWLLHV